MQEDALLAWIGSRRNRTNREQASDRRDTMRMKVIAETRGPRWFDMVILHPHASRSAKIPLRPYIYNLY